MGRRLSDLDLKPDEGPGDVHESVTDVTEFLSKVQDMCDSGKFTWADDTLEGIYNTVSESGYVTSGQQRAVENIAAKRSW